MEFSVRTIHVEPSESYKLGDCLPLVEVNFINEQVKFVIRHGRSEFGEITTIWCENVPLTKKLILVRGEVQFDSYTSSKRSGSRKFVLLVKLCGASVLLVTKRPGRALLEFGKKRLLRLIKGQNPELIVVE